MEGHNHTHSRTNMNAQQQCELLQMPAEIRNAIYCYALTSSEPIIDPTIGPTIRPRHKNIPILGTALLRTCKKVHAEVDLRVLYSRNAFCFTRPVHATSFFRKLGPLQRTLIRGITIDFRMPDFQADGSNYLREWMHYLESASTHGDRKVCCQIQGPALQRVVPHLDFLAIGIVRLQFESADWFNKVLWDQVWFCAMRSSEWIETSLVFLDASTREVERPVFSVAGNMEAVLAKFE